MQHIENMIEGSGGIHLFTQQNEVDNPIGAVVILHGYCEHSQRYAELVELLTDNNIDTYLLDHRGHGKSEGPRAAVMRFEEYLEDLDIFMERVRKQVGDKPLFLLGHSMGGLIACDYLLSRQPKFDGVVLSSPYLGLKVAVPAWKDTLARILSKLMPGLSLKSELDPNLLTHDSAIVQEYVADDSVSKIANARWYTEASDAQAYIMENAGRWSWPALVMHGGDDRIADPDTTRKFYVKIAATGDVSHLHLEGMYHEILNEVDRKQLMDTVLQWLKERMEGKQQ